MAGAAGLMSGVAQLDVPLLVESAPSGLNSEPGALVAARQYMNPRALPDLQF